MANRISLKTTNFLRHNLPSFYQFSRPDQHIRDEFEIETVDNVVIVFSSLEELADFIDNAGEQRIKKAAYRYTSDWIKR